MGHGARENVVIGRQRNEVESALGGLAVGKFVGRSPLN